ncbi:MAG: hypothetical protein OIF57_10750 [Marinobacterium sp.]|nr:hypothetical protein [Marinobacterium sp.]
MLSTLPQSGQTLLRTAVAALLLGCLVLSCLQMSSVFSLTESTLAAHHMDGSGEMMAHDCCKPDSSHCPLEIPLVKLFFSADSAQFFPLCWLLPLAIGLMVLSLLRQLLYRLTPFLVGRSYLPSYPRLHVQQQVFLN